jgi:hypothetical protein
MVTVDQVKIRFPPSLAFAASARRVEVGKSQPDKTDLKRWMEMAEFGGRGLVHAEARIEVGERVFEKAKTGLRLPSGKPMVVAGIDRETRADFDEWLLTWADRPHSEAVYTPPAVMLDPERFEHVLLAWAFDRTEGGNLPASLAGFAAGDVPADCARTLAAHLQAVGLLYLSPGPGPTVITMTAEGAAVAELAATERGDPKRRAEELRNGIIRWLWEWDGADASADFHDFVGHPRCTFRGHFFDLNAVYHEYVYLVEKGLVYDMQPWWFAPGLTAAGRDCAAYYEGNVHEHLNPPTANGPTVNFNGTNSGNLAIGRDVTQTTNPVTAAADVTRPAGPGTAENPAAAHETETEKKASAKARLRAFATGTAGVITLVATVVIAVFTILIWIVMTK